MNMQEPFSELMRVGKLEGAERRHIDLLDNSAGTGKQHQGGVVSRDGTEFDLCYRFEDSLGDGDNHEENSHGGGRRGGRQGDVRDGKGAKGEAAFRNKLQAEILSGSLRQERL
jgi:hypothetical protein